MGRLQFQDLMDFYPKHNASIYKEILAAQKKGGLVPFVGAGMSVFCGYKLWDSVLEELAEYILEEEEKQAALKLIKDGCYEEAAQKIEEEYPDICDRLPELFPPENIANCPNDKIQACADSLLPYLFQKDLVITTNFDHVLEEVYLRAKGKPLYTVIPSQPDRLAQFCQDPKLGLFKLHGDIGSEAVAINDLVFTKAQYDEKYGDKSVLVNQLTQCFKNRRLLFLGCSLNVDRTMDVLKRVTLAQPGVWHYAIVGCKKKDRTQRLKELHKLGIRAIFYDSSNHDAVRVILERLLEESDPETYQTLPHIPAPLPAAAREERSLLFDADYFPFTGRKQEWAALEEFCAAEETTLWWAVTGPGGMGKSRLVYEFANELREKGWRTVRYEARPTGSGKAQPLEALEDCRPDTMPTLVVLDDIQAYMAPVATWIKRIVNRRRSEKLRILLLEREGEDLRTAAWLDTGMHGKIPEDRCHKEQFLALKSMSDAELAAIMRDYAKEAGCKKDLDTDRLLKTLERVDPAAKRPLYAVAIAEAAAKGEDPARWDRKKVLDALLDRELDFPATRLEGMSKQSVSNTMKRELRELLTRSCVEGLLPLRDVEMERYPQLKEQMRDLHMDAKEFLEGMGLVQTVQLPSMGMNVNGEMVAAPWKETELKVVMLSCPDLIKEHLILNMVLDEGKQELLFSPNWDQNAGRLFLIMQLVRDYPERIKAQLNFWQTIFQAVPRNGLAIFLYGKLLWGYAAQYSDGVEQAVDRLARLYEETDHSPTVAVDFAKGLVNLTVKQDLPGCTESVGRLEALYQKHADQPEIAETYARGLVNLTVDQDLPGCTESVGRLETLYQKHADQPEIAVRYAKGLVNLTVKQDLSGRTESVGRLEALYQKHADQPEIAVRYAQGLVNLTVKQDLPGRTESVGRLEALYQKHADQPEIAVEYAKGLVSLMLSQKRNEEDARDTFSQLEKVRNKHPENSEIQHWYDVAKFILAEW